MVITSSRPPTGSNRVTLGLAQMQRRFVGLGMVIRLLSLASFYHHYEHMSIIKPLFPEFYGSFTAAGLHRRAGRGTVRKETKTKGKLAPAKGERDTMTVTFDTIRHNEEIRALLEAGDEALA